MGGKYLTRRFIDADYTNIIDMKSCRNLKEDNLLRCYEFVLQTPSNSKDKT